MNTYKAIVKVSLSKTVTKNVEVLASDSEAAKLQLEVIYGKRNVVTYPALLSNK